MLSYRLIAALLRFALRVFYRRVVVVGLADVPAEGGGPVIFAGNHPNSLLDPALITATCGRVVHFAAKDVLFRGPVMRALLARMGAVPLRRRDDHGGPVSNDDAFEALYDVLGQGRAMGIFPEGLSHDQSELQRLKTGAARVALGAARRHPGVTIRIVPTGLHYVRRQRFRTSVLVQYGEPIAIDADWLARADADEREAARALTEVIERRIRALTVNAPNWETLRALDAVRRLYQPDHLDLTERIELARRFNEHYPKVAGDPAVAALLDRVRRYEARLTALGLTDHDLVGGASKRALMARVAVHGGLLLMWLPLALLAAPIHAPLGLLLRWLAWRFAPRKDVVATTKFLVGLLLVLAVYGLLVGWALWSLGWVAALQVLLLLPLSGYATLMVVRRFDAIDRKLGLLVRSVVVRPDLDALRAERARLSAAVVEMVQRLRPAELELLYPSGPATPARPAARTR
ncbi:MAG: 1-acyl-sn-glycerol-3-phosphate acyltransferase [Deltaproteobacteria bacterium]|nr:1-acyl-sn-glycerol-3-phosphate acyltransferase [Deltaproteobacteria bacterium]